ncbi:MAG: sulfur carrier protein ThiS [Myxococcota bacterium]|nr:sulfur carrier protein ThiS [Myxococcota bacterium]
MQILLNGEQREVESEITLAALLQLLDLPGAGVALALNRQVVPRDQWPVLRLTEGDRVEIVRAVGGG